MLFLPIYVYYKYYFFASNYTGIYITVHTTYRRWCRPGCWSEFGTGLRQGLCAEDDRTECPTNTELKINKMAGKHAAGYEIIHIYMYCIIVQILSTIMIHFHRHKIIWYHSIPIYIVSCSTMYAPHKHVCFPFRDMFLATFFLHTFFRI